MPDQNLPPIPETLPVVATHNLVVFPYMVAPMLVGRPPSMAALDAALQGDRLVAMSMQRDENIENPTADDVFPIGCATAVVRMMRTPDGNAQVIVQGLVRIRLTEFTDADGVLRARVEQLPDPEDKPMAVQALMN